VLLEILLDISTIEKIRLKYPDNHYDIELIEMHDNSIRIKIIADDFNI
jgi:DNA-dependent RNA polymerase auxiliary subunit epsilon